MDPYRVLKVSSDAPDEVIRAAYKVLASKYHPDKNPGSAQAARTMQHVNDAYALLSDPIRRSEYDRKAKFDKASPAPEPPPSGVEKVTIHCQKCACEMRVSKEVLSDPGKYSVTCPDCRQDPFTGPVRNTEKNPEPSKSIIKCKHCGQSMRILSDAIRHPDRFEVICPKCNQDPIPRLGEHRYEQEPINKPPADLFRYVWSFFGVMVDLVKIGVGIAVVVAGFSVVLHYFAKDKTNQAQTPSPQTSTNTSSPVPAASPAFSQPVQPLPRTGDNTASFSNGVAPLTIKTSSSEGSHYFVKIAKMGSGLEIGSYFIRSGETLNIQVPVGIYELRYATCREWYGTYYLFGPNTTYSKAESFFTFSFDGNKYSGYTVELITQRNGNLRTSRLQPSQW